MMNKNVIRKTGKITCVALACILALSAPSTVFASAASTEKDETVYVNMDTDGKVKETIVSDWLHSDSTTTQIPDKSDLKNIENVKSNENPIQNGDSLTWVLNRSGSSGANIYYKGTTDKKPPLNVGVTYFLDGSPINGKELAGKSGKVKIHIKVENTEKHEVTVNGKTVVMYTPMTAIVTTALPTKTFQNVQLSDGKLFSDGNTQMVVFLTMPGMNQSLNLSTSSIKELNDLSIPEEFDITADVKDFELSSIAVAATPELVGVDKLKDADNLDKMKENLTKLKSIQDDIEKADPNKDVRSLFTNPDRTAAARLLVDDVFNFYDTDQALADILPQYVTTKNVALYDKVTSDLDKADIKYVLDDKVLRGINDRMTDENIQKGKKLLQDYDEIQTFQMSKLDDMIDVLDDYDDVYDRLDDTLHDAKRAVNRLSSSGDALKTMKKISSSSSIQSSLRELQGNVNTLNNTLSAYGLTDMSFLTEDTVAKALEPIIEEQVGEKVDSQFTAQMNELAKVPGLVSADGNVNISILLKALQSSKDFAQLKDNTDVQHLVAGLAAEIAVNPDATVPFTTLQSQMESIADGLTTTTSKDLAAKLAQQICSVAESASDVQEGLTKAKVTGSDIDDAASSLVKAMPVINDLSDDLEDLSDDDDLSDNMDKMQDLLLDKDNVKYLTDWAHKIRDMKKDLDDNSENVGVLKDLLKEYDDPKIKAFKDQIPTLMDDMDESRPILESLKDKLALPVYNASLHKSPQTVSTLLKMKDDVMNNRKIMEILRLTTSQQTAGLFKTSFDTLDDLKNQNAVDDYLKEVSDADDLIARKDEYVKLSDQYGIFTQAADGASTKLKFVMKTDEIKKPEATAKTVETATAEKKQGFFSWVKTTFQNVYYKISHKL
ncbi:hypothetical protein [Caproiciproducens faecalis]|uniref:X-X-X-Leu-X-X-Gly heptad repeat-containing protein n=1 Tax=Caproiciproducens faecalis TaxID=2820301 RepID=A0ABS7DNG4_9FIRM|nr:hypothetical protein [Caproiciproducens faecalis]MBW7572850.1 hypothetical protein [Caproiciproducens faecalis]